MEPQEHRRCSANTCPLKRKEREEEDNGYLPTNYAPDPYYQPYSLDGPDNQIDGETYRDAQDPNEFGPGGFGGPFESGGFSGLNNPSQYRNELSDLAKRSNALLERYQAEKAMICRQCQMEAMRSSMVPKTTNLVLKAFVESLPSQDPSKYSAIIKPVTIEIPLDVELLSPQSAVRDFQGRISQRPTGEDAYESFKSADDYYAGYGTDADNDSSYYNPSEGYQAAPRSAYGLGSVPYGSGSAPLSSIYRSESSSVAPKHTDDCACSFKDCQCYGFKQYSEESTISIDSIGIQTDFSEKALNATHEETETGGEQQPEEEGEPIKRTNSEEDDWARKRAEAAEKEEDEESRKIKEVEKEYIEPKDVSEQRMKRLEAMDDALHAESVDESEDHDDGDVLRGIPPEKRKHPFVLARPQHKYMHDICTRCMFDPSPLIDEDGKVFCPGDCGCCLCPWIRKPDPSDTYERVERIEDRKVTICKCKEKIGLFPEFDATSHCSNVSYYDYCPCRTRAEAKFLELYGFDMHDEEEKRRRKILDTAVTAAGINKVHQRRPASVFV